MTFFVLNSGMS